MEDDGFLKELFGECTRATGQCLSTAAAWRSWVREEPEALLLSPGREPLVPAGLSWGMEATCHSGEGGTEIRDRGDCVCGGDMGGRGTESGTRAFPPWRGDLRWRSWHETGQSSPLCSSVKAS